MEFPVELSISVGRIARVRRPVLSWVRESTGWALVAERPDQLSSLEITLSTTSGAVIDVPDWRMYDMADRAGVIQIALIVGYSAEPTLLRVMTDRMVDVPEVMSINIDERVFSSPLIRQPASFFLVGAVPNPFNPTTSITFGLPMTAHARVTIYNTAGQVVRVLVDGPTEPGIHSVSWNGRDGAGRPVASGVYLCRLVAGERMIMRRMLLVR